MIEFDAAKNERNILERGLSFSLAERFDWSSAIIVQDTRKDYGELRYRALGLIDENLFALVFTVRGERVRVISLRKANRREIKHHALQ